MTATRKRRKSGSVLGPARTRAFWHGKKRNDGCRDLVKESFRSGVADPGMRNQYRPASVVARAILADHGQSP
jgi:hypothetical protein